MMNYHWYYIVDKEGAVSLRFLSEMVAEGNAMNWTDGLMLMKKLENPVLLDPFTVAVDGVVVFKLENPAIITAISENILKQ